MKNNKFNYTNIYFKSLCESLFDDDLLSDFYVEDDFEEEVNKFAEETLFKAPDKLVDCRTVDEVTRYLINKYELYYTIYDMLSCTSKNETYDKYNPMCTMRISYNKTYYIYVFGKDIFGIDKIDDVITYRNKEINVKRWILKDYNNNIFKYKYVLGGSSALIKILESLNEKIDDSLNLSEHNELSNFIFKGIEKHFSNYIINELTCEGKVYKVVPKDIQRMTKCLYTKNYAGFDKITNAAKMAARLTAVYIINYNRYNSTIKFNDELILNLISNSTTYNTKWLLRKYDGLSTEDKLLIQIKKFPELHIKDIIKTFNQYKDD